MSISAHFDFPRHKMGENNSHGSCCQKKDSNKSDENHILLSLVTLTLQ